MQTPTFNPTPGLNPDRDKSLKHTQTIPWLLSVKSLMSLEMLCYQASRVTKISNQQRLKMCIFTTEIMSNRNKNNTFSKKIFFTIVLLLRKTFLVIL